MCLSRSCLPQYTIKTLIESSNLTRSIGVSDEQIHGMRRYFCLDSGDWVRIYLLTINHPQPATTSWLDNDYHCHSSYNVSEFWASRRLKFLSGFDSGVQSEPRATFSSHYPSSQAVFNVQTILIRSMHLMISKIEDLHKFDVRKKHVKSYSAPYGHR